MGGVQILFCSGVWSYVVASIATPTFILVPLLTIWFGIFPIVLSWWAALGLSIYYIATCGVSALIIFWFLTQPPFPAVCRQMSSALHGFACLSGTLMHVQSGTQNIRSL